MDAANRASWLGAFLIIVMGIAALGAGEARADSDRGLERIPGRYIVVYRSAVEQPAAKTDRLERARGFDSRLRYGRALKGFSATLSERQVDALRADPNVAFVSPDRPVEALRSPLATGDVVPAGVRRIGAATATEVSAAAAGNVAVIDTGIDLPHGDLNAVSGRNCVSPGSPAQDDEGHGTHVAGTIGARNDGSGLVGVAPGTKMYAVKVLDSKGSGTWSQIICGIDWVTSTRTDSDPANDISVANMSLGGQGTPVASCSTTTDPMHRAICGSTAAGVTYVVAAGNEGWDFDYAAAPDVPAAYPQVLTVTAIGDTDGLGGGAGAPPGCMAGEADDRYASFSNFPATSAGLAHTIAAPGVCIVSAAPGGRYATMSGTSMAAPHVAGLAALCLGESGQVGSCAGLTPAEVIAKLRGEADAHNRADTTYGFAGDTLRPRSGFSYGFLGHPVPAPPPAPEPAPEPEPLPVLDTTPPSVVSLKPAPGAAGVGTGTAVSVSFSEAMDTASAQAALSLVRSSDGAPVPGSYGWSGNTLSLRPATRLTEGTAYTARLSASARDLAGNQLAAAQSWSFTTSRTLLTSYPYATTIDLGSLRAGSYSLLAADDNSYYQVNSNTGSTRQASWVGRVSGVSNATSRLAIRYRARSSIACSHTIAIYRWTTYSWVQIDARTLGTSEVQVDRVVTGALADYVSGTSGNGEVRIRLRCSASSSFYASADLLSLGHYRN